MTSSGDDDAPSGVAGVVAAVDVVAAASAMIAVLFCAAE